MDLEVNWKFKSEQSICDRSSKAILEKLLNGRGVSDVDSFLNPSVGAINDPFLLEGVREASEKILSAINKKKKISIYGDFDVDGIAATALMLAVLKKLGAEVDFYIPHRLDEGYGLNMDGIKELREKGTDLIVTVDCGINGSESIDYAHELGMEVIVTDHHLPEEENPALIKIDPYLSKSYPYMELAGVGVAFKLCQGLEKLSNLTENFILWNLDLVALGTVADIMPLTGENRVLTALGLKIMNEGRRPGIVSLLSKANFRKSEIQSWHISFIIAPRINALGRLEEAKEAVDLLGTYNRGEASIIAEKLEEHNVERKKLQEKVYREALKFLGDRELEEKRGIILSNKGWHEGIIGIVASKIAEDFNVPTILIAEKDDICKGSGRSVPEFNIISCIRKLSGLLEKFGGHTQACGISIKKENIGKFKEAFEREVMESLLNKAKEKELLIEFPLFLDSINRRLVENLQLLAPFGTGNPAPVFASMNIKLGSVPKIVGNNHLKFSVKDGDKYLSCIGFSLGDKIDLLKNAEKFSIAYSPFIDDWNGQVSLKIHDIKIE
jgi:single-stranded-DNA-specific exonuclease